MQPETGWSRSTLLLHISGDYEYVKLLRGGKLRTLERTRAYLPGAVASPSGESFVYDVVASGGFVLREATFAHPNRFHRVTRQEAEAPEYSPGQTRIFYSYREDSGSQNRYLVDWAWLSGSSPHQVHFPGSYHSIRFGGITNA